ncbi:MAG: archease [Candidatus Micrarchaeia archaeon]
MKYRFLEHTADVLFEAYGDSFGEAVENAAAAMFDVMCYPERVDERIKFEVEEKANTLENLAVFTLSTILSECEVRGVLPKRFEVKSFSKKNAEYRLQGVVYGGEWESSKVKKDVKAVTHHMVKVERDKKFRIRMLLDI